MENKIMKMYNDCKNHIQLGTAIVGISTITAVASLDGNDIGSIVKNCPSDANKPKSTLATANCYDNNYNIEGVGYLADVGYGAGRNNPSSHP